MASMTSTQTDSRLDREREFHDRVFADETRAPVRRFYTVTESMRRWYADELAARAHGNHVLEYGCGPGSQAYHLAAHGASVTGIDLSPVAIDMAREHGEQEGLAGALDFRVMDAEHLDLPDRSFDVVCGSGILHHLDLDRAYAELARVLRPGGVGVFIEPMGHNPAINRYRDRTPSMRTVDEHPLLMADLERAGAFFGAVDTRFFALSSLAAVPLRDRPAFESIVRVLNGVDRTLFTLVPPIRRHAWMVGMVLKAPRANPAA
jgi:SAM-dependent methyltransferase